MDGRRFPDAWLRLDGLHASGFVGGMSGRGKKVCGNGQRHDEYGRTDRFILFVGGVWLYGHLFRKLQRAVVSDVGIVVHQRVVLLAH